MSQASPGMHSRDFLSDDSVSIRSFDTILPSYSEATLPSYTAVSAPPQPPPRTTSSRLPRVTGPPSVPNPQILSISQSNLPLRFNGPQSSPSHPWAPKIVYPTPNSTRKKRPGAELNIFFRSSRPATEALAHGDTSEVPILARRASSPRTTTGRSFDEEARMKELDELTRRISGRPQGAYPRAVPQIAGSLRRESTLLGDEWDNLAVEAQREEIVIRISELEAQVVGRKHLSQDAMNSLREGILSLQVILATRKEDVAGILASQVSRLRQLKQAGTRVSHLQKDQIKTDMLSMKAEITFLEQRAADLDRFARIVEQDDSQRAMGESALEDDSKTWDIWFETTSGHR
jgi:hypothetical protein